MNLEDFENLIKDEKVKERLEKISKVSNYYDQYKMIQVLLEYINAYFLTQNMKIEMENYSISKIVEQYGNIDEELYNKMLKVNSLYETFDSEVIDEDIINLLLIQVDEIFHIILTKYGGLKR